MSERLVWVDKMRGLAILSVVVQHLSLYYVLDFAYAKLIAIANMSVFFFISGYIWERTAHVENIREAGSFILKKSIQLVIPLVVWTFISPWFFHIGWELPTIQGLIAEYEKPHLWFLLTLYGYVFWFALYKLMLKWGGGGVYVQQSSIGCWHFVFSSPFGEHWDGLSLKLFTSSILQWE